MELESCLIRMDGDEIGDQLARAGLAAGPIHDTAQVVHHPHTRHRDMAVEKDWYKMTGTPIKFSRTPGSLRSVPPRYGEHSHEILREFGFDEAAIAELIEQEVVLLKRRG